MKLMLFCPAVLQRYYLLLRFDKITVKEPRRSSNDRVTAAAAHLTMPSNTQLSAVEEPDRCSLA
jgi:hypothetical protein